MSHDTFKQSPLHEHSGYFQGCLQIISINVFSNLHNRIITFYVQMKIYRALQNTVHNKYKTSLIKVTFNKGVCVGPGAHQLSFEISP